jgi:hypothetical protein
MAAAGQEDEDSHTPAGVVGAASAASRVYRDPSWPAAARSLWGSSPPSTPWGQHPTYLIHDRDRVYGADFATRLAGLGIESVRTPVRAPRANAIGERVVRTLRRECLDHILPLSERHVRAVLAEYANYYNQDRPHRSLGLETPVTSQRPVAGEVVVRLVLGGLHHVELTPRRPAPYAC